MSTFYAAFRNVSTVRQAAAEILENGVSFDDVSVVANQNYADLRAKGSAASPSHILDSTDFVGSGNAPKGGPSVRTDRYRLSEDYFKESSVGGGISTSEPEDSISKIDEADESQALAEQETYERRSRGTSEAMDLQ